MSRKRMLTIATLLSLFAVAACAQTLANNPPQNQNAPQQGSGQGTMGNGQTMGSGGTGGMNGMSGQNGMNGMGATMGMAPKQQAAKDRGIIGISIALSVDAVGAPGRLIVRGVMPYSPAYNAGIERGDQIVAVDGRSLNGKSLSDVAKAIRGNVGAPVRLRLSRQGKSRDVSLTRVEPPSDHDSQRMSGHGDMGGEGMMDMMMNMTTH